MFKKGKDDIIENEEKIVKSLTIEYRPREGMEPTHIDRVVDIWFRPNKFLFVRVENGTEYWINQNSIWSLTIKEEE